MTIAGVRLRNSDKPFGLSGLGAIVVIALYAVGFWLAFLTDVGLFLIPGHVFVVVYAVSWGALLHRGSRAMYERYESYLRRTNEQEQELQWAVDGPNAGPRGVPKWPSVRHHAIYAGRVESVKRSSPHTG